MKIRDKAVQIRLTSEEVEAFRIASGIAGLSLSSWIRSRIRISAIRELECAGRRVPFIEEIPLNG